MPVMSAPQTLSCELRMPLDLYVCLHIPDKFCITAGTGKVSKVKKGTWLDQTKIRQELGRKPLSAHQQRQLAHTAAGVPCPLPVRFVSSHYMQHLLAGAKVPVGPLASASKHDLGSEIPLSWSGPE